MDRAVDEIESKNMPRAECMRFAQLNMQNSSKVTAEARKILEDHDVDFLLGQEPYSVEGKVRGFGLTSSNLIVGNHSDGQRPMAAIIAKPRYDPLELVQYKTTHFTSIVINTTIGPVVIISAYFQFADPIEPFIDHLDNIIRKAIRKTSNILIGLDANAHSPLWHSSAEDDRGVLFTNLIMLHDLVILNKQNQPTTHKSGTNIDITMCTINLADKIHKWTVHENESMSDHRLITFELQLKPIQTPHEIKRYNFKKANYAMLNNYLHNNINRLAEQTETKVMGIEDAAFKLTDIATRACEKNIPRKILRKRTVPWWNYDLTRQRETVKQARRMYQRCCECRVKTEKLAIFRRQSQKYKRMIKDSKKISWEAFVAEAINDDPYSLAYKIGADKVKAKEVLTTLSRGNACTETNLETMQLLIETLVPRDSRHNENQYHATLRANMQLTTNENQEHPFSLQELENALSKAKDNKAAGLDNLPVELYKNFDDVNKRALLKIFNACWLEGIFPKTWKIAKLIVIRKAGDRDWSDPAAYRPISLLPTIGKIFERMIVNRLNNFMSDYSCMSDHQFGFREARGTVDAIERVKSITINSTKKYVAVILVDIKGAFDSLWWPTVFEKLRTMNASRNLQMILRSYLNERKAVLEHDGETLEQEMTRGCPQGSVLGPVLWNATFDELLKRDIPENVTPVAFADDVAFVVQGNSRNDLEYDGNQLCEVIMEWAEESKMTIATQKTKGLLLKGKLRGRSPWIRMNGQAIEFVDQAPYLGVILDPGLTFLPHVKKTTDKAKTLMCKLTRLIQLRYGVKLSRLLFLYKTVFVPLVGYASRTWIHRLRHTHVLPKVREAQRQALINLTGAYRTTSLQALCAATYTMPIYLKLEMDQEVWRSKKRLTDEPCRNIRKRYHDAWQLEWRQAETGRYTFGMMPDLEERRGMLHLRDLDHIQLQLLTGHGAFGGYLYKNRKRETPNCEDCGQLDDPLHSLMECNVHEDVRNQLSDDLLRVGVEQPWTFQTVIRHPEGFQLMMTAWKEIYLRRDV